MEDRDFSVEKDFMLREYVNIANNHLNNNPSNHNNNHTNNSFINNNISNINHFFKQLKTNQNNYLDNQLIKLPTSLQHFTTNNNPTTNNNLTNSLQHFDYVDNILQSNIETANSYFNDNSSSDYASRESYESICNLEQKLSNDLALHSNGIPRRTHSSANRKTFSLVNEDLKNFQPSAAVLLELQTALQQNNYLIHHFSQQFNQLQNDHQFLHQKLTKKVANKLTRLWKENTFLKSQIENYFKKPSLSNSLFSSVSSHDSIQTIQNTDKLIRKENYNNKRYTPPQADTLFNNITNLHTNSNYLNDLQSTSNHTFLPTHSSKTPTEHPAIDVDASQDLPFHHGWRLAGCLNDDEGFLEDNDEPESHQNKNTKVLPSYQQHMQRKELQHRKELHSGWRLHRNRCNLSKSFPNLGHAGVETAIAITKASSNFQITPVKSTSSFFEASNVQQSQNNQSKQSLELIIRTNKNLPFTSCLRKPIKNRPQTINHTPPQEPSVSTTLKRSDSESSLDKTFCRQSVFRTNLRIKKKSGKLSNKTLPVLEDIQLKGSDDKACVNDAVLNEREKEQRK